MTVPLVKICGLKTPEIVEATLDAGADMVGFMYFQKSPRHVRMDDLAQLISLVRGRAESTIVLVNPDNSVVAECAAFDPDYLQLHGSESPERVANIRAEAGIPIMKALPIGDAEDVKRVADYNSVADRILLDAKPPKTATRPGGLGKQFDWTLLKDLDPGQEFMLSGGLTPENVADAVASVKPMGVDASSGLETAPGEKSIDLIRAFVTAVKSAN